jgi:hypothetical protein
MKTILEPCHPRIVKPGCTCYSFEQLKLIAKALSDAGHTVRQAKQTKQELWRSIDGIMRDNYETEFDWAWRNTVPVKKLQNHELMHLTFRPSAPEEWTLHVKGGKSKQGKFVWLSNFDIDAVLKQYTSLAEFEDFKFFNSAPIDFEKIGDPLSRVNPVLFRRKNINRFAAVINLDTHDQSGSHWCCVVGNFKTGVIAFFDSYASYPEHEIQEFMAKMVTQAITGFDGAKINPEEAFVLTPLYNVTRFQMKSSECGVFSLYTVISFILSDGTREAFSSICGVPIDDDSMNDFRRALFVDSGFKSSDYQLAKILENDIKSKIRTGILRTTRYVSRLAF